MFIFQAYPGENLLIAYDPYFKFGENFYLALTEEAKERILKVTYGSNHIWCLRFFYSVEKFKIQRLFWDERLYLSPSSAVYDHQLQII